MMQIICPHCLERVDVPEASEDPSTTCPACLGLLGSAEQDELTVMEYDVSNPGDNPNKSDDMHAYVQYLERRARKEKKQQPYERKRFPVELVGAMVFFAAAFGCFLAAFLGELGIPMLWKICGGMIFIMLGVLCLRFAV